MEKIKVGITVENNVEIPKYMTEGAAGIDVSANIEKEIELVNPSLIVALGEKTYSYLLKNNNFLQNKGKFLKFNDIAFIAIYSPSFLLRNPSLKKETYFDMLNIKRFLEELN